MKDFTDDFLKATKYLESAMNKIPDMINAEKQKLSVEDKRKVEGAVKEFNLEGLKDKLDKEKNEFYEILKKYE